MKGGTATPARAHDFSCEKDLSIGALHFPCPFPSASSHSLKNQFMVLD